MEPRPGFLGSAEWLSIATKMEPRWGSGKYAANNQGVITNAGGVTF